LDVIEWDRNENKINHLLTIVLECDEMKWEFAEGDLFICLSHISEEDREISETIRNLFAQRVAIKNLFFFGKR
jgi:hypothetical protein